MNQNIIRNVSVNVDMKRMGKVINTRAIFNQKDVKTAILLCRILMGGVMDLSNCSVRAEILKPDNTESIVECQILDPINGIVAVGLTPQCLSVAGEVKCELVIQSDTQTLYSPVILYNVVDNLVDPKEVFIRSSSELPILTQLISHVQKLNSSLQDLESTICEHEKTRYENECVRVDNELKRTKHIDDIKLELNNMINTLTNRLDIIDNELENINSTLSFLIGGA